MNRIIKIAFLILLPWWMMACSSSNDVDNHPSKGEVNITTPLSAFLSEGGSQTLRFQTTLDWEAKADQAWVKIEPNKGQAGLNEVMVSVAANETYDERNASIEIRVGETTERVLVISKQKDAVLLTSNRAEVTHQGGEVELEIQSNIDYECEVDTEDKVWIKSLATRGLSTSKQTFKVEESPLTHQRTGKIWIKSALRNEVFTVYQSGEKASMILTQSAYDLDYKAQEITIELTTNAADYTLALPNVDWLTEEKSRAVSTYTHHLQLTENTSEVARKTSVLVKYNDNGAQKSEEITIVQQCKDFVKLSEELQPFESTSGKQTLKFDTSDAWTLECSQSWLKFSAKEGKAGKNEVEISCEENTLYSERLARVTLISGEKKLVLDVIQNQKDALILSKNRSELTSEGGVVTVVVSTNVTMRFDYTEGADTWIKAIATRSLVEHNYNFEVSENPLPTKREGGVIFSGEGLQDTLHIYQAGNVPTLVLTQSDYQMDAQEHTIDIKIKSNTRYEMQPFEVDWLTEEQTRQMSTYTHHIRVAANTTGMTRSSKITFTYEDGKETKSEVVTITQSGEITEPVYNQQLVIRHTLQEYRLPELVGTAPSGEVNWGDETPEVDYVRALMHKYTAPATEAQPWVITIRTKDADEVYWTNIEGINELDFSKF